MEHELKVGDMVELRSGSPKMTITHIGTDMLAGSVFVSWFHDGQQKKDHYSPDALRKSESQWNKHKMFKPQVFQWASKALGFVADLLSIKDVFQAGTVRRSIRASKGRQASV